MKKLWQSLVNKIKKLLGEKIDETANEPKPEEKPVVPNDEASNGFSVKDISWCGPNFSASASNITVKLTSAIIKGANVHLVFDRYSWPVNADGGCDAIICFFRKEGEKWIGGKFDWIRKGGQSVKTMENIRAGYGGHKVPASGSTVAFMFVSVDGKQRTNAAFAKWS